LQINRELNMRKKILTIFAVLGLTLAGCASAPPFDPNVNPFIGEWVFQEFNTDNLLSFVFTENEFTMTSTDGTFYHGTYSFTRNRVTMTYENRRMHGRWSGEYRVEPYRISFGIPCPT
jgi:hypothetical protein